MMIYNSMKLDFVLCKTVMPVGWVGVLPTYLLQQMVIVDGWAYCHPILPGKRFCHSERNPVIPSALSVILSEAKNLLAGLSLSGIGRCFAFAQHDNPLCPSEYPTRRASGSEEASCQRPAAFFVYFHKILT